jgi:ribosome-associated protein
MDLEVTDGLIIPARELHWKFSRSSGPGGQHVNTSDSRVQLTWSVAESTALDDELREVVLDRLGQRLVAGAITITVSEQRSQLQNRRRALDNLAALLQDALERPAPPRRPTRPTRGSARRHRAAKEHRSEIKQHRQRPPAD